MNRADLSRRGALLAGGALAATALLPAPAEAWVASEAATTAGRVRGIFSGGAHIFKGIPYAASTLATRFAAPAPIKPWRGVRPALQWPAECPQYNPPATGDVGALFAVNNEYQAPQSEDCLALNIWTPGLADGVKRPVMVWLHGGGFTVGSGSSELYDGTRLAAKGDVVVVTLNHRLNLFGYLYLAELAPGARFADSGNAGMLDIIAALRWLRDNIAAFGGDPGNITIFGQSGGGAKVSTLLAMPAAKGLFHKAIVQSGPGVRAIEPADAGKITAEVLRRLELTSRDIGKLATLPTAQLARILAIKGNDAMGQLRLGPVVDGHNLPRHPFDPTAPTLSADVPLLIGSTADETTTIFGAGDATLFSLAWGDLEPRLRPFLGPLAADVVREYRAQSPDASPSRLYSAIMADYIMRRGTIEIAERRAALGGAPTFVYWFSKGSPRFGGKFGAPHGIDIPYVFDNVDLARPLLGDGSDRYPLAEVCSAAWISFARHGSPAVSTLPRWRPYTPIDRATMILDDQSRLAVDPNPAIRGTLSTVPRWVF
ncbi:MAG: carboxylesterase/lipase family protein [Sphingobium sp.]|nr:carboxylesterase/lipase family protein [Sphingobium sp.]